MTGVDVFDFDTLIDFRGADSVKWNRYAGRDVLPLWVADMDFATPPAVIEALQRRVARGVFGYSQAWPSLIATLQEHLAREYHWRIEPDWLVWLPGLVTGLNVACRAVGAPGNGVLTAAPVYPPFLSAPQFSQRTLISAPLALIDDVWQWDLAAAAAAMAQQPAPTRLLLLCHPHNPVGRVWRSDELQALADFAAHHDLIVCSDEIHCGLILEPGLRHQPFATLSADAARRSITLMAPSKTFNVPGLGAAFAVIPDAPLRRSFLAAMHGIVPHVNVLGMTACEAAFSAGGPWHAALLDYLRANRARVAQCIAAMPGLTTTPVEATYLSWIDAGEFCRTRGIAHPQRFFEQAGVGLSAGGDFSPGHSGQYLRLNFGCPRATLDEALQRMAQALA